MSLMSLMRYVAALIAVKDTNALTDFCTTLPDAKSPDASGTAKTSRFLIHCFGLVARSNWFNS